MSAGIGADPGAPNLNLSSEEKRVYGQLFRQADGESAGVVTGEVAVKFFEKTRLDSRVLGEIWQIADKENRGFLTPAGFGVVLRLIGHAQAGKEPTPDLALQQGPIPRFEGLWPPQSPSQPHVQPQSPSIRIPPLTPDKVAQYSSLFERQNLQGGYLPGEQARSIFDKSGLANETLGRIWGLADTDQRGALALPEFIIAMHLLTSTKTGALRALPNVLPPGLYEAASRAPPPATATAAAPRQSPSSTGMSAAIPRQLSGSAQQRNGSPLGRPPLVAQLSGPSSSSPSNLNSMMGNNNNNNNNNNTSTSTSTGTVTAATTTTANNLMNNNTSSGSSSSNNNNNNNIEWAITPQEKIKFDKIFEGFDKTGRGFITGEEAVPFLSQSQLPEDTLAQIWDLADFDSAGRLSQDGFAVAMYLIRQQRNSRGAPLPATLPVALIPPHRRNQGQTRPTTAMSSAFDPAPATVTVSPAPPKSALDDLFGLDSSSPSPAMAPTQTTMSTGGSNVNMSDPFGSGSSALRASSPPTKAASPHASSFKPFQPSSSFGRNLTGQAMGDSAAHRSLSEDLLGDNDNDNEAGKKISEDVSELANLSNHISSLTRQTQELQSKRATTQVELNQTNSQKQNFEQRLAHLRQQYDKEAQDTHSLEERLRTSRADTHKLGGECMTLEGQLRDIQGQHQQVLSAFQADQQENVRLRDRIRAVSSEISQLKPQIEKLKLEARQQKGLVAINKKQLSTTEGERDKLRSEADSLAHDLSRQADSGSPASASAQLASPSPSGSSGNNPFFKRTGSADIMGVFAAQPAPRAFDNTSFDDLFGPAGPAGTSGSTGTPPPVFRQQHTGQSSASVGSYSNISASSPNVTRRAPQSADPPASSDLRQLTSANLPFPEHSESLSSSTQVSPPTSRAEGSGAGSFPFPGGLTVAAEAGKAPVLAHSSEDAEGNLDGPNLTGSALVDGLHRPTDSDVLQAVHGSAAAFDSTDSAKAKEDFDNAFAAFASSKPPVVTAVDASKPLAAFDSEFPPISELEREDSDSASEGGGFDDDFAPASPAATKPKEQRGARASTSTPEAHHAHLDLGEVTAVSAAAKELTLEGKSPELPSSPATITHTNTMSGPITQASDVDDFFGSGTLTASSHHASQSKGAFDDLDDDFEGLEDAKEGSADDDFANISRSGLDDFNPMFDSSPPASQAKTSGSAGQGSQQKGNPDWDAIFANLEAPSAAAHPSAAAAVAAAGAIGNAAAAAGNVNASVGITEDGGADSRPPAPGRALTEGGDHDDPLLQKLMSMGYSRQTSLNALEKFDYDIEQAANFLASQS